MFNVDIVTHALLSNLVHAGMGNPLTFDYIVALDTPVVDQVLHAVISELLELL